MPKTRITSRRSPAVLIATAFVLLLAIAAGSCTSQAVPRVRVVLITLDTLRYDSLAGSADRPSAMPLTRAWAEKGVVFERFYSVTSATQPSHATMFTGLQPWQHGLTRNGQILNAKFVTLAERLKQAGFTTAAVVASVPVDSQFGFSQGFDVFVEHFNHGSNPHWEGTTVVGDRFYCLADTVTNQAIELLDRTKGERQFYWFHYFDPHEPYGDSAGGPAIALTALIEKAASGAPVFDDLRRARTLYDADVGALDRSLNRLLQRLHQNDKTETHIVMVSDHGESFGEDGAMGHGQRINEEQIHVPLVIESPRLARGTRGDVTASVDIAPTLLSLAGVTDSVPGGRDLSVRSDAPRWVFGMRRTFVEETREWLADGKSRMLPEMLFYFADGESIYTGDGNGVATQLNAATSIQMAGLFRSFEAELRGHVVEEAVDEKTQNALKALGYTR
jgi:arylsulfatase A-like enzyme